MADALAVHCRPLEETRGPNCCCQWLAECEVEVGSLSQAEAYVNMVRARAAAMAVNRMGFTINASVLDQLQAARTIRAQGIESPRPEGTLLPGQGMMAVMLDTGLL